MTQRDESSAAGSSEAPAISISLVGVGDAGSKVLNLAVDRFGGGVSTVAVNTDAAALSGSCAAVNLQIGANRTGGLGAGGDTGVGRLSAEDDLDVIRTLFVDVGLAVVVVGMGGGTGTGATSTILRAARESGALTLCLATLPFSFEGTQRRHLAEDSFPDIRRHADTVVVISNDRLFETVDEARVTDAFEKADRVMGDVIEALVSLIMKPGYIKLDFADLRRMVESNGGVCTLGYGNGTGRNKGRKAVAALLEGPLLEKGRLAAEAGSLMISIVGGPDLTLREVGDIMGTVASKCSEDCHVVMGTVIDDGWKGRVTVTAFVSEIWKPAPVVEPSHAKAKAKAKTTKRGEKKTRSRQAMLRLEPFGRGRFKDVEPTILDGEDLDTPTFVRRGMKIEKC